MTLTRYPLVARRVYCTLWRGTWSLIGGDRQREPFERIHLTKCVRTAHLIQWRGVQPQSVLLKSSLSASTWFRVMDKGYLFHKKLGYGGTVHFGVFVFWWWPALVCLWLAHPDILTPTLTNQTSLSLNQANPRWKANQRQSWAGYDKKK